VRDAAASRDGPGPEAAVGDRRGPGDARSHRPHDDRDVLHRCEARDAPAAAIRSRGWEQGGDGTDRDTPRSHRVRRVENRVMERVSAAGRDDTRSPGRPHNPLVPGSNPGGPTCEPSDYPDSARERPAGTTGRKHFCKHLTRLSLQRVVGYHARRASVRRLPGDDQDPPGTHDSRGRARRPVSNGLVSWITLRIQDERRERWS